MHSAKCAAALAALLAATPTAAQLPPPGLEVGQRFPSVAFRDVEDGRAVSIDDFRGDKVLVAVFASW
jgi:hypothetical protein